MEHINFEVDPPFKFFYEDGESQVLVQIKTYDLEKVINQCINFFEACGFEREDILEEMRRLLYEQPLQE
jgi:hypothetical protein